MAGERRIYSQASTKWLTWCITRIFQLFLCFYKTSWKSLTQIWNASESDSFEILGNLNSSRNKILFAKGPMTDSRDKKAKSWALTKSHFWFSISRFQTPFLGVFHSLFRRLLRLDISKSWNLCSSRESSHANRVFTPLVTVAVPGIVLRVPSGLATKRKAILEGFIKE